jgi:hypothetical protein
VKLDKLFGYHIGPKADDIVWTKLNAVKAELHTPKDVRMKLRHFKIKNKHYDCCRIFCDTFTDFKVDVADRRRTVSRPGGQKALGSAEPIRLHKILLRKFENIYCSWRAHTPYEAFFSYDYLLRYLLTEVNSSLIAYCKAPTSKRRRKKYDEKLRLIKARQNG